MGIRGFNWKNSNQFKKKMKESLLHSLISLIAPFGDVNIKKYKD